MSLSLPRMNIRFPVILLAVVCLVWTSCAKKDKPVPILHPEVSMDVAYGVDAAQKMDVYLPAQRSISSTPMLVIFHGGAWISGDKSDLTGYVDSIQRLLPEYAVANVNYRLASFGVNLFPTQEKDADAAVQFLVAHSADYHISGRFVYLGVSAGGQMALLQAYKYHSPAAAAVISFFGPTDMKDLSLHSPDPDILQALPFLMGGTALQNPSLYFSTSPIHFVTAASCPTLLLQGGKDPLVPPGEANELTDSLKMHGVVNQLAFYPNQGHGWTGADLSDSFQKMVSFLHANVH